MSRTKANAKVWLLNSKDEPIIGGGKANLLQSIREEGSLNKACKKINMSYKHAWLLLKEIEDSVGEPMFVKNRGGNNRGTFLTEKAINLLDEYNSYKDILTQTVFDGTFWEMISLKISARNQMKGKVVDIKEEGIISKIKIEIEPTTITAVITKEAADTLDVKIDDNVVAIVKSTEVMIGKE